MRLLLKQIDRLPSSPSGNPRWRLHFDGDVVMETRPDAMLGYAVGNYWLEKTFEVTPAPRHERFIDDMVEVDGVAWAREETEPCQRGTSGCAIDHGGDSECEAW